MVKVQCERIVIQPDWDIILRENSDEAFWIQYKHSTDVASDTEKLRFKTTTSQQLYKENRHFKIATVFENKKAIDVKYKNESVRLSRRFVAPVQSFAIHYDDIKPDKAMPVFDLDVTSGGLGVSCSKNGSLLIWLTESGQVRRILHGHIEEVNVSRFFPSGLVVLSGGADFKLKVWSAEDSSNPVTVIAHGYGVSDVCVIDKGRNVLSVGRDGECKLVDVGTSKCLAKVAKFDTIINGCSLKSIDNNDLMDKLNIPPRQDPQNEREIGTENKIVSCACEDGRLRVLALRSRELIYEFNCESSVNCCCFLSETKVACGTQNGQIFIHDILENKTISWKEFRSAILSIASFDSHDDGTMIVTTGDGSCFISNFNTDLVIDLTGPNCDPVYKAAFNNTHIFTCCRDGLIRKYSIQHLGA